jgi:hypothetical protein
MLGGVQDEVRQGKARQGKARQGKARQGKARQGKARQDKARQGKARQGKARQGKARQRYLDELHFYVLPNAQHTQHSSSLAKQEVADIFLNFLACSRIP